MNGADELELLRILTRLFQEVRASDSWVRHTEAYDVVEKFVAFKRLEEMFPDVNRDGTT